MIFWGNFESDNVFYEFNGISQQSEQPSCNDWPSQSRDSEKGRDEDDDEGGDDGVGI